MIPPRYNLYNQYQPSRVSVNQYQPPRIPFNRYQPPRVPYSPYQTPRIPFHWHPVNNQQQQQQHVPTYNNDNYESNVVWSSKWTEWVPASKVEWKKLKKRTFARENLRSLSPKSFAGNPTSGAINSYKGMVKKYFSGILPSKGRSDKR